MIVGILQSNYLPWKGYFDIIRACDVFVFYDDVEYSKGSWRNRNKFKTPSGPRWLTVPLQKSKLNSTAIDRVLIAGSEWQSSHLSKLEEWYGDAPCWQEFLPVLQEFYQESDWEYLSEMNQFMIKKLSLLLGISNTQFYNARDLGIEGNRNERLINICNYFKAKTYLSGPSAKSYIEEELWQLAGINILWQSYDSYPEYPQLYPPFEHHVSIMDMFFMLGSNAKSHIG